MAKPRITIVGLGLIGTSIGYALMQGQRNFEVVGHDKDGNTSSRARKQKAVDKTEWNLISACDGADLVILALPALGIRETLEAIAGELKPGCVVMDTATVKYPVLQWAEQYLRPDNPFVGTNPIVASEGTGSEAARADLFHKATWAICLTPTTPESGIKTVTDLTERLGAQPLFLDAVEHDGMMAAVEHLPALASMAVFSSAAGGPAWTELRRLAGGQFESTTHLSASDSSVLSDTIMENSEQVLRVVDTFIENMVAWRALVADGDREAIAEAFSTAVMLRELWLMAREKGRWEDTSDQPTKPNMLMTMLGFGRMAERRQQEQQKGK